MRKGIRGWILMAAAAAMLAAPSASQAGILGTFSGNTKAGDTLTGNPPEVNAIVNFAVFDTTGGSVGDTWGIGLAGIDTLFAGFASASLDTTASYLYIFQITNKDTSAPGTPQTLGSATIDVGGVIGAAAVTSSGQWYNSFSSTTFLGTGPAMTDGAGVVSTTNAFGSDAGIGGVFAANAPAVTGGVGAGPYATGLVSPLHAAFDGGIDLINGNLTLIFQSGFGSGAVGVKLGVGETSLIVGYTTNLAPAGFGTTQVLDTGTATGNVPVPTPEAANLISLLSAGLVGLGFVLSKRSK